jgi:hypothetical protein
MKRVIPVVFIMFIFISEGFAQEKTWNVGLFSFFDNVEFDGSAVKIPQTMSGIMLAPEGGLRWDSLHSIFAGVSLMHEFGSAEAIDNFYPTLYYQFSGDHTRFLMGAFPRSEGLDKFPRIFFQDSVYYYRPNINGMLLEFRDDKKFFNVWLDWTGRQSEMVREAFFVGFSGKYNFGHFYLQHSGSMFHFASRMNPFINEALHDNLLLHTSAGVDLSGMTVFEKLDANAGWVVGLERSRADNTGWIGLQGLLIEARAGYKFIELFNSFYAGDGLMNFYGDHGNDLYWGDPAYRAPIYNRADISLNFISNRYLNIKLTYSLHFLEGNVYHEQMLKVRVNLNNR